MVFVKSWSEYQAQAEKLYQQQPERTRYCVKYRAADGLLVLKVTDDHSCIKYKTRSSIMLNRFEAFNLSIMSKMQNRRPQPLPTAVTAVAQAPPSTSNKDVVMADASAVQAASGGSGTAGGAAAKKKKAKKKK
ncbi:signal recognition particle, SRP9/SRP14 subunit [Serendipita vermifera]|nr:signal recognition particle, SRP9/SRP14 subunit [Serendipita vermifera]